jgi:hypothetical protein
MRTPSRADRLIVKGCKIFYPIVRTAFTDHISTNDTDAVVLWWDTLSEFADNRYFKSVLSHQIVNRIPKSSRMCVKVSLAESVQRMQLLCPGAYRITPTTYVLPRDVHLLAAARRSSAKFILKPANGSLGYGIQILPPGAAMPKPYDAPDATGVAQEYIEPLLLDGRKFDLRVYALVACLDPLRVFISRDGIARFCAEAYGSDSLQATLTNTAVNKTANGVDMADITRTLDAVLPRIGDADAVLQDIGRVVVRTVIAALPEMRKGYAEHFGAEKGKCFQIFGFDVLFTRTRTPLVLEVNYRPSLAYGTEEERALKVRMLSDGTRIAWEVAKGRTVHCGRFMQVCPDPTSPTDVYAPEIAKSCHSP